MAYEVLRAAAVARDLELIFDFLTEVAEGFGESPDRAFALAEARLAEIERALEPAMVRRGHFNVILEDGTGAATDHPGCCYS